MSETKPGAGGDQRQPMIPISAWVRVPSGPAYAPARAVLAAVDVIHGDGEMRPVAIARTRSRVDAGEYRWRREDGEPLAMRFSSHSDHPHLTIAHEVGHFVDQHGFGQAGRFGSTTGRIPTVVNAIQSSRAVVALRGLVGRQQVMVEIRPGRRERHAVLIELVAYLLRPEELFARAYAQYVAVWSGHPELLGELARVRASVVPGRVYHPQWEEDDFAPIGVALDSALREKGWTT